MPISTQNKLISHQATTSLLLACIAVSEAFSAVRILPSSPPSLRVTPSLDLGVGRPHRKCGPLRRSAVVMSTPDDALVGGLVGPNAPRSFPDAVLERLKSGVAKIPMLQDQKAQRRFGVLVKSLWWLCALPFGIAAYLATVHVIAVMYKACPQCVDPMNILLFSIKLPFLASPLPVCLWNLSHLIMYYHFVRLIPFKKHGANHAFAIFIGILWFYMEPALFTLFASKEIVSAAHACSTQGLIQTVYESTWRPRADDMVFNTGGQILYEVVRYVRNRKLLKPTVELEGEPKRLSVKGILNLNLPRRA